VRGDGGQFDPGTYREARGTGPDAVAFDAEDGGLVDVARAEEAVWDSRSEMMCTICIGVSSGQMDRAFTSCRRMLCKLGEVSLRKRTKIYLRALV